MTSKLPVRRDIVTKLKIMHLSQFGQLNQLKVMHDVQFYNNYHVPTCEIIFQII